MSLREPDSLFLLLRTHCAYSVCLRSWVELTSLPFDTQIVSQSGEVIPFSGGALPPPGLTPPFASPLPALHLEVGSDASVVEDLRSAARVLDESLPDLHLLPKAPRDRAAQLEILELLYQEVLPYLFITDALDELQARKVHLSPIKMFQRLCYQIAQPLLFLPVLREQQLVALGGEDPLQREIAAIERLVQLEESAQPISLLLGSALTSLKTKLGQFPRSWDLALNIPS